MRITLQGWQRNHGENELFAQRLSADDFKAEDGPLYINDVRITAAEIRLLGGRHEQRVTIAFGKEGLRLGGDYLGRVTVGQEDAALLFALAFRGVPAERAFRALADAEAALVRAEQREGEHASA